MAFNASPQSIPQRRSSSSLEFSIERRRGRRRIAVCVSPGGQITVRAPMRTSLRELEEIVARRRDWIVLQQQRQRARFPGLAEKLFKSGEVYLLGGKELRLAVCIAAIRRCQTSSNGREILMQAPCTAQIVDRRRSLLNWYRAMATSDLSQVVARWSQRMGLQPAAVLIRDQRSRWGSCNARDELRLNWRIVQAPGLLQEYVVVHEVAHIRHKNHGPAFWQLVAAHIPDFRERQKALRQLTPYLSW